MIDAWLIDLDGTLYRARPLKAVLAFELVLKGWRAVPIIREFRRQHERLRAMPPKESAAGPLDVQLERTARALGKPTQVVTATIERWMVTRPCAHLYRFRRTGLLDEITAFRQSGGRTALVSDYPARAKLAALDATHLFDAIVANGETQGLRSLKPDPAGYLLAADLLQTAPERCLVIGDREDADGAAAHAAGMQFRLIQ